MAVVVGRLRALGVLCERLVPFVMNLPAASL